MKPLDCLPLYDDAWFYDQEFATRDHEIPFYRTRAVALGGPILEMACGSGRLTLPIARAGLEIEGVDVSSPMIERARLRAAEAGLNIKWHVQDVRNLDLGRKFHFAFIATNALQHLHDVDSVLAFFASSRAHLAKGGCLVVDIFNPVMEKLARKPALEYFHKEFTLADGRLIQVRAKSEYHADGQILQFDLTYLHKETVIAVKHVRMRCFFPEEMLAVCRLGGFEVTRRYGDYDESAFSSASPKQILECRILA